MLTPRKQLVEIAVSLLPSLALLVIRPIGVSLAQRLVLGILITTIIWWVTGIVEKTAASVFLLIGFLIFSGTSSKTVFAFPLSQNFLMIVFSFLFSQGIMNSGLIEKLLQPLLFRYAQTFIGLLMSMLVSALLMIFIIPQPFSRIIILSLIFNDYYDKIDLKDELRSILLFALFVFSTFMNMLLLRGDIILNGALFTLGGIALDGALWMRYMTLPTIAFTAIIVMLFILVFRKELSTFSIHISAEARRQPLSQQEKSNLALILIAVILWTFGSIYGLNETIVVIASTVVMFARGMLKLNDLKTVNIKLLVFLTAVFSIGGVMMHTGIADLLFTLLMSFFPSSFSTGYAMMVLGVSMALHMVLGSNITSMSVAVPGVMAVGSGVVSAEVLLFLIYLGTCGHFILPFHNVILLLGEGNGYFSSRHIIRLGLPLTIVSALGVAVLYLNYWRIAGLL